jgi:hypothetical protein
MRQAVTSVVEVVMAHLAAVATVPEFSQLMYSSLENNPRT